MNKNSYIWCLIITVTGLWMSTRDRAMAQPSCYMIDAKGTVINLSRVCQSRTTANTAPGGNTPPTAPTTQGNATPPTVNQTNNNGRANQRINSFGDGIQGVTGSREFAQPANTPSRFQRRLPVFRNQPN